MPTGVEIREVTSAASAISSVGDAILLIGTAPIGPVNVLTLSQSATSDADFGSEVPGFTIPKALAAYRKNAPNAKVLVINVADETYGTAQTLVAVTNETKTLVAGATQLAFAPESSPAPVVKDATLATTYVQGTDYTISATGAFARVGTAIGATDVVKISYSHLPDYTVALNKVTLPDVPYRSTVPVVYNVTKTTTYVDGTDYTISPFGVITRLNTGAITASQVLLVDYDTFNGIAAADIIGTATPRTGLYLVAEAFSTFGFEPTLWDCPGYLETSGVMTAFRAHVTNTYLGQIIADIPSGLTIAQAETARGAGSGNFLDISDERVQFWGPRPMVYDVATEANEERYLSSFICGFFVKVATEQNPARSLHNYPAAVLGIEALSIAPMSWDPSYGRTTDVSRLNDVEINTLRSGSICSGTKSSRFRDATGILSNYNVRRVADIVSRSLTVGANQFNGQNINAALIDAVKNNAQAYLDSLAQQGTIVSGTCVYNPADNPQGEINLGHLTFAISITVQIALERLTFQIAYTANIASEA